MSDNEVTSEDLDCIENLARIFENVPDKEQK